MTGTLGRWSPGGDVPALEPTVIEMTPGLIQVLWITPHPHPQHELRSISFESKMASAVLALAH